MTDFWMGWIIGAISAACVVTIAFLFAVFA